MTHLDRQHEPGLADGIVRLGDGRALGYAEYGDRSGTPVLLFPGTPSSRLIHPPEEPTRAMGARLIVVERPDFGRSGFLPRRTLLGYCWGEFLVVSSVVYPAEGQLIRDPLELRRIVTEQQLDNGYLLLRLVRRDRGSFQDAASMLRVHVRQVLIEQAIELLVVKRPVLRQAL